MIPSRAQKGGSRVSVNVPETYHRELVLNHASNHLLALGCGSFCQNHVPEVVPTEVTMSLMVRCAPSASGGCLKSLVSYLKRWDTYGKTKSPCQADVRTRNRPASSRPPSHLSPAALGDSFPSSIAAGQLSPVRKPCPCSRDILWTKSHKALVSCYPRL